MTSCLRLALLNASCGFPAIKYIINRSSCTQYVSRLSYWHHDVLSVTQCDAQSLIASLIFSRKLQTSSMTKLDPCVTLFYRPSGSQVSIKLQPSTNVSLDSCSEAAYVTTSNSLSESLFHPHQLEDKVKERSDLEGDGGQSIDDMMCKEMKPSLDYTLLPLLYIKLAKIRLTGLVVVTSMAGYALAPGSFDAASFLLCCIGTCFTSASANAINQFFEVPFDSQMTRTRTRPLVRALLSPLHAVSFAAFTGVTGTVMLACGINQLTATLGVLNLLLYTMFYTPMKRLNIANTWLGSVVGAIPPMMGWAASAGTLHTGALLLGAIMYAWQFPHFCALSWNLRPDYSRAGYRMMSVVNPALCQRTALQYSMMLSGLCTLLPYFEVTTWTFAVDSLPLNLCLVYLAWRFYNSGDSSTSRRLFHFSLIHIPALLILMLISKKHFGDVVTGDGFTSSRNIQ